MLSIIKLICWARRKRLPPRLDVSVARLGFSLDVQRTLGALRDAGHAQTPCKAIISLGFRI